jgi:hypothetical protein
MLDVRIAPPPLAILTRALSRFTRAKLAGFIGVAIDLPDFTDSDTDLEPNGDDRREDEFVLHGNAGLGWPIADPDFGGDERGEPDNGL